jgi:hypothetical protein
MNHRIPSEPIIPAAEIKTWPASTLDSTQVKAAPDRINNQLNKRNFCGTNFFLQRAEIASILPPSV